MNNKDKMHPEDMRNLIIFMIVSIVLWFLYETYVMKPQAEAMKKAEVAKKELLLKDPEALGPIKPLERSAALQLSDRISLDNGEVYGTIPLEGGRIDDVRLHKYFKALDKKETVEVLSPPRTKEARYIDFGWVSSDTTIPVPDSKTLWQVSGNRELKSGSDVLLFWENGQGLRFERVLSLDKKYAFTITQRIINTSAKPVSLAPYALVSQMAVPHDFAGSWMVHEGPMGFIGENLIQRRYDVMRKEAKDTELNANSGWIGISDKYWLTALIPQGDAEMTYRFRYIPDQYKKAEKDRYQLDITGHPVQIASGGTVENKFNIYAGVKRVFTLQEYEQILHAKNFDLAVDFGWFWFFTYPFFFGLHYLGVWTGNMGLAIIVATILVRCSVYPLTRITYMSFAKLKKFQPQIAEIREKYKDDKEQMQREMVELYQREGVNPLAGCFPMLVQIPIFFAFYKVLLVSIELRHAPFFGWIKDLSVNDPTSIFNLFGLLPFEVPHILLIGVWPCLLFCAFMIQKQLNPPPQDAIQRDMANLMPYVTVFVMAKFASGLVIYWTFSALVSSLQQMLIMRSLGVPIYLFNKDHYRQEMEKKSVEGASVHPLMEMAEGEVEKALFGEGDKGPSSEMTSISAPKPKKKKKKK